MYSVASFSRASEGKAKPKVKGPPPLAPEDQVLKEMPVSASV